MLTKSNAALFAPCSHFPMKDNASKFGDVCFEKYVCLWLLSFLPPFIHSSHHPSHYHLSPNHNLIPSIHLIHSFRTLLSIYIICLYIEFYVLLSSTIHPLLLYSLHPFIHHPSPSHLSIHPSIYPSCKPYP